MLLFILFAALVHAEDKYGTDLMVPKLTAAEAADAPSLAGGIYPEWGEPCTNFTYRAVYSDKQGRAPAYVRIWLNGVWHDMAKVRGDYSNGALYEYYYVPNSGKGNFYYFEASNGAGKARASIIDSPDNGPLMYTSKFDSNQIILLKKESNAPVWVYETGKDVPSHVALSKDGKYLAAATADSVYLFSTANGTPLWKFCQRCSEPPTPISNYGGVALSADGSYVAATISGRLYFFGRESNKPEWSVEIESNAIGVDMSDDGKYVAAGVGNSGELGDSIFLFGSGGRLLWKYKAAHPSYVQTGNFYRPDITPDGSYVAVSTGCPDRRAYLFSNNGTVAFRSEQLTRDSPVHKSAISDDASLIAYSLDHSQGEEILMLFSKSGSKLWGFSSQQEGTARAVSISSDGRLIAAGTTAGNLYLFSKNSNVPLWKFTAKSSTNLNHIGDVKLSPDGNYLVAGGTGKKVYFFSTSSAVPVWEYNAKEWINSVDFAAGYVAAATGMAEFQYEGNEAGPEPVVCRAIIQPPIRAEAEGYMGGGAGVSGTAECGNTICEPSMGETALSCRQDCMPSPAVEDTECFCMPGENCPKGCMSSQAGGPINGSKASSSGNGTGRPALGTGCIYEKCDAGVAEQQENGSKMGEEAGQPAIGGQQALPPAQPKEIAAPKEGQKEKPIPACEGVLDAILNFIFSLFGSPRCK